MRNLAQEGRAVIAQRVFDFVAHGEARLAQQLGLPHLRDARAQLRVVLLEFGLASADVRAPRAARRSNVRRRADSCACTSVGCAVSTGETHPRERTWAILPAPTDALRKWAKVRLRLGSIRLVFSPAASARARCCNGCRSSAILPRCREIAEGANDRQRLLGREVAQQLIELAVGLGVAKVHRVARSRGTLVLADGRPLDALWRLAATERRRIVSMRSKASSPSCSRTVSPSSRPRSRTSSCSPWSPFRASAFCGAAGVETAAA